MEVVRSDQILDWTDSVNKPADVLEGLTTNSQGGVADFHGINAANGHLQLPTGYKLALKIPEPFTVGSGKPTQASFSTVLGRTHRTCQWVGCERSERESKENSEIWATVI